MPPILSARLAANAHAHQQRTLSEDFGYLVLRLGAGGTMFWQHGWPKLMAFGERVDSFADPFGLGPAFSLIFILVAEVLCSALIVLGLWTRIASIPLIIGMAKSIQIEKVKNAIIDMIHYSEEPPEEKYSEYLSKRLECDYNYLSNLFSEVTGSTLQQFIIINKIERAKELIIYNELSLKEICFKLHYSSVPHFSNQFKKITGLSPMFFKSLKKRKRISLEHLIQEQTVTIKK